MKKLIAIAVLFAGMTAAVFAQDGGWSSGWKFGLSAQFVTDMLFATSAKESYSYTATPGSALSAEFGGNNKGSVSFFPNNHTADDQGQRLLLSISNEGENYKVYADIKFDGWATKWGSVYDFLTHSSADWYANGNLGIFSATVGTAGYSGWVGRNGSWGATWNNLARFGVWRYNSKPNDGDNNFIAANTFTTFNQWGAVFAVGIQPVDQIKFALGYRLNPSVGTNWNGAWGQWNGDPDQPYSSKSNINANFLLSGKPLDGINFDLFYAVQGGDNDTLTPDGKGMWKNTLGAYVGVNLIDNLGLSIGYTGNFNAYETDRYDTDPVSDTKRKIETTAPFYSGVDLGVNFTGIDKIGLLFAANVSFAGANGKELSPNFTKVNRRLGPGETSADKSANAVYIAAGSNDTRTWKWTDGWFHLNAELVASLNFIDGVPLTFIVEDQLGVATADQTWGDSANAAVSVKKNDKTTENEFRVKLAAEYGVGSATLGIGLEFGVATTDTETTNSNAVAGSSDLTKTNTTITKFAIPLTFKVAF